MNTAIGRLFLSSALLSSTMFSVMALGTTQPSGRPPLQYATAGNVDRHYVYSPQLADTVTVDVWTPRGYDAGRERPYPVIYMHDGQNLFDASTSWNHQSWEMDSVTGSLIAAGAIEAPVIVGIHSVSSTRIGDLMPQKALAYMDHGGGESMDNLLHGNAVRGDAYAAFIVETLMPAMDSLYTLTGDASLTSVMGSSMGGLMSIYAMCEYPEVFGNAACLSTHWVGSLDGNPAYPEAMRRYLVDKLPRDGRHRLYLDHGTTSIDSLYGEWEERMIEVADSLGYHAPATLETFVDEGAGHEERFWARRVERPLRFLLGICRKP